MAEMKYIVRKSVVYTAETWSRENCLYCLENNYYKIEYQAVKYTKKLENFLKGVLKDRERNKDDKLNKLLLELNDCRYKIIELDF